MPFRGHDGEGGSSRHAALQQSPLTVLPSSHCSPGSTRPLPQSALVKPTNSSGREAVASIPSTKTGLPSSGSATSPTLDASVVLFPMRSVAVTLAVPAGTFTTTFNPGVVPQAPTGGAPSRSTAMTARPDRLKM